MKSIKCNAKRATPYLRKWLPTLGNGNYRGGVDLGCGNCRNTHYAISLGWTVMPFDGAEGLGYTINLGKEVLPIQDEAVDLILCNYVLCFLNEIERFNLIQEIDRIARFGAHLFVEMYPAKQGHPYDINDIIKDLGWKIVRKSKHRFTAVK